MQAVVAQLHGLRAPCGRDAGIPAKLLEDLEPVPRDRLRSILQVLRYLCRDAWQVDGVQVPEREKQMLLQRVSDDVRYVEREACDIERGAGDKLYVDIDTPDSERLQMLSDRIAAIWKIWYPGGAEHAKPPQYRRGKKPRGAPDTSKEVPRQTLWEKFLYASMHSLAGYVAEWRVSQLLLKHFPSRFIRSLESAPVDGALLLDDYFQKGQESLERHQCLRSDVNSPPFLPIEIKLVSAHLKYVHSAHLKFTWDVHLSRHRRGDGIVILASPVDPDHIVVFSVNILRLGHLGFFNGSGALSLGCERRPGQTFPPAFPSNLQPYRIKESDLYDSLEILIRCARGDTQIW